MYPYLVEFIGTAILTYVMIASKNAIAVGATYTLILLLGMNVSGGHLNPAVSIAEVAAGRLSTRDLLPYVFSQIMGALVALELFKRYTL